MLQWIKNIFEKLVILQKAIKENLLWDSEHRNFISQHSKILVFNAIVSAALKL